MTHFEVVQQVEETGNWEPIPEGSFATRAEAESAMAELEESLGWERLRVDEVGSPEKSERGGR